MLRLDDGEILKRFDTAFSVANNVIATLRQQLSAPVGANLLVYHLHSLAQRTKDVRFIVRRMLSNARRLERQRSRVLEQRREESIEPRGRFSARYCRLSNRMDEIVQALRLDFEALFHIGSVAYDHFAVSCKHLGAHPPSLRAKDKFEFHELVEHLDSKSPSPVARALGDELAPEIRWLHYWMRSYRNGFVVHPDRPLHQSLVHGPGSKFALFTPAHVGWNDDEVLAREINALLPHAPKAIRDADPTYWERARPRALLQRVLQNIGAIASFEQRQRIASIARKSGHETPSFQIVASVFPDVIARALPVVRDTALQNRGAIDLGTKESRWVVQPRRSSTRSC